MISSVSSKALLAPGSSLLALSLAYLVGLSSAWAAESSSPMTERATTQLVVRLATDDTITVQSRFEAQPPTLHVKFPEGRVTGSLPERSVIHRGAIEEIRTAYGQTVAPTQSRWVEVLSIRLRAPYPYTVRPEAGRVVITIEHPANISSDAIELGLPGGTIISGVFLPALSERFRAMQEALLRAGPPTHIVGGGEGPLPSVPSTSRSAQRSLQPQPAARQPIDTAPWAIQTSLQQNAPATPPAQPIPTTPAPRPTSQPTPPQTRSQWWWTSWWWMLSALAGIGGFSALWWVGRREGWWERRRLLKAQSSPLSSATRMLEALVWRAFERQGYQLIQTLETVEAIGTLRIIAKDGAKAALMCVGDGAFFEKTLVEQFARAMRGRQLSHGYLVAPGSFTVPAQRYAKANGVVLMSREHLIELLSTGANSEHTAAQLQKIQAQLEETKETIAQYAQQLDVIRRQRNEASWFLAEARATASKLEQEVTKLSQEARHWQAEAEQAQQLAQERHKQWEESQWYLGEAKAAQQHQVQQLTLQHEACAYLETKTKDLHAQVEELRRQAHDAQQACEHEQGVRQRLEGERLALRRHGERRRSWRLSRSDIRAEVRDANGGVLFEGAPRDLSRTGIGLDSTQLNDHIPTVHVRLRLPELDQPIEATGRIVWQQQALSAGTSRIGCEFAPLAADADEVFGQALERLS